MKTLATSILIRTNGVLRASPERDKPAHWMQLWQLAALIVLFGVIYGAIMGTFGGITADRALQITYSAIKVPLLLFATFALSLPSFFVINTIFGLREDFAQALKTLIAAQAGLAIVLASLAPFTVVWYLSVPSYPVAILFNCGAFAVASFAGQYLLRKYYAPLIAQRPAHRIMMWGWLAIYAFVGIQMGWVLRPFIGSPDAPTTFTRAEAWSNAYLALMEIVRNALGM